MNRFVFDVDGTLTPSRGKIHKDFAVWFKNFATHNKCYFVTGSDKMKTVEQVGLDIYNLAVKAYNCNGNDVYEGSTNIKTTDWKLPDLARTFLVNCQYESNFSLRTGNHIEERPGMVNFSVVGRNASLYERKQYVDYDTIENERTTIANAFNIMFPDLEAKVGGETGIDISPKGADKSQILNDFDLNNDNIIFFGDAMQLGGNDEPLATANKNGCNYHVKGWEHTWEILREYSTDRS